MNKQEIFSFINACCAIQIMHATCGKDQLRFTIGVIVIIIFLDWFIQK